MLRISADLDLPIDMVTDTSALLAKKGAGKSNAAVKIAEELHRNDVPFVTIDPKGDWWGIRSSGDGQSPGLPVVVFGGKHGDVPLEATAGALIADLILGDDDRGYLSCVLDVSQFSYGERDRFLLAFGERLFRQKDEERVLHLIFEEAHEYLPQLVGRSQAQLVGMYQRIVKQGRFKGLGVTLVSQRSAALNKGVLTQADNLFMLRTTSPQDRAAVKAWFDEHADAGDIISQLPHLANGECWLWSPERFDNPQHFTFGRRETFDSGATPKVGEKRVVPRTLADVDLGAVKEAMADTIEKAKADDPRELRKQIAELTRSVDVAYKDGYETGKMHGSVEVPVLTDEDRAYFAAVLDTITGITRPALDALTEITDRVERIATTAVQTPTMKVTSTRDEAIQRGSSAPSRPRQSPGERITPGVTAAGKTPAGARETRPAAPAGALTGPQQRIVDALAWLAAVGVEPASRIQVGMIAGYHPRTKGFTNGLGTLSTSGYVTYPSPGFVCLTSAGAAASNPPEAAPTSDHLQQMVFQQVGNARARILREVIAVYPDAITRADLAERLDYHERTKGFTNGLGSLRTLGLIDYPSPGLVVATDLLFID